MVGCGGWVGWVERGCGKKCDDGDNTSKQLLRDGIASSTRTEYDKYINYWFDFCDWDCIHIMDVTEDNLLNFITWCLVKTTLNSGQVSKTITSVGSWLKENGVSFIRKDFPTIKRAIDGYFKRRPPTIRRKKPFCHIHCELMFRYVDVHDFNDMTATTVVLLAYKLLLRPSEIAHSYNSKKKLLNQHIVFIPSFGNPKEISVTILYSKTNQQNKRLEKLFSPCTCYTDKKIPCVVHRLRTYILWRNRKFNNKFTAKDPVFVTKTRKIFRYQHLNNFMFNVIKLINRSKNIKLNPANYTPHALRVGGCTDMARNGEPGWFIEQFGRWSSKIWKDVYINLDWSDLALLHKTTQSHLLSQIRARPYVE